MTSSLTWTGPLLHKESFMITRLTGTPLAPFTLPTFGLQAFQMILPLASFITNVILLDMDLFIPSSCKPGKKIPPSGSIHSRNISSKTMKMPNHLLSKAHQQNHFLSGWLSLLLVYRQSCLPKILPIIFPSTKQQL